MTLWLFLTACRAPVPVAEPSSVTEPSSPYELVVVERGAMALDAPLPTVVALHGLGDAPERFVHSLDGLPGPVRIIAVGAPEPWGDEGHAWWTRRVADGDWQALGEDVARAADDLAPLLASIGQRSDVCGAPVVTGFSQGGMLSFALAGRHPDTISAAVPVAGTVLEGVATGPWAPTRALHGTADTRVPYDRTQRAVATLQADGADVTLESFPGVEHSISRDERDRWYSLLAELLPPCPPE